MDVTRWFSIDTNADVVCMCRSGLSHEGNAYCKDEEAGKRLPRMQELNDES